MIADVVLLLVVGALIRGKLIWGSRGALKILYTPDARFKVALSELGICDGHRQANRGVASSGWVVLEVRRMGVIWGDLQGCSGRVRHSSAVSREWLRSHRLRDRSRLFPDLQSSRLLFVVSLGGAR